MFTVARLGIDGRLAVTLTTSNPIESMLSIARTTNRNVTRWRDGQMVLRWTAAGMLNAEQSFRRVKGYEQMPQLIAELHRRTHPETATNTKTDGAAAQSSPRNRHRKSTRPRTPSGYGSRGSTNRGEGHDYYRAVTRPRGTPIINTIGEKR
jgi:hypothetical protein